MVNISNRPTVYKDDEDILQREGTIAGSYIKTYGKSLYLISPNIGTIHTNFMVTVVHTLILTVLIYIFAIPLFIFLKDIFPFQVFLLVYCVIMTYNLIAGFFLYIYLGNGERYFLHYTDYIYLITFSISHLPITLLLTVITGYFGFIFSIIQFFISYFYISNGIYKVHIIDTFGKSLISSILIFLPIMVFQSAIEGFFKLCISSSIHDID